MAGVRDRVRVTGEESAAAVVDRVIAPRDAGPHRPGLRIVLPAVVVIFAAAVLALQLWWQPADDAPAESEAPPTADMPSYLGDIEGHVVDLLTYTPKDVRANLAEEKVYLTGEFADAFVKLTSSTIAPDAVEHGVSVNAKAIDTGLSSATDDQAILVMFVETTTRSERLAEPRVDGARLKITVQRVDGEWLISELDPV